jgi:hypothetical protein
MIIDEVCKVESDPLREMRMAVRRLRDEGIPSTTGREG